MKCLPRLVKNRIRLLYRVVQKKGNTLWAAILKYFMEVTFFGYIFGKFGLFYVSGEKIMEKDARMSLIR